MVPGDSAPHTGCWDTPGRPLSMGIRATLTPGGCLHSSREESYPEGLPRLHHRPSLDHRGV